MFTHLHTHTEYSLLDGLSTIPDLVARAKALGQDALAITDHGNLHGALQFYEEARANEIKPIIGIEGYVAPGSRFDRGAASRTPFHLTLLAQNETGYRNLLKLSTASHLEGFYYRPRVDRELLEQHNEGLIALSACPSGEVMTALKEEREPDAREALGWYSDIFRGRYYVELQEHGQEQFSRLNPRLVSLARDLDLPLVLTNDSHYTAPEQEHPHDVLLCIGTNSTIHETDRMKLEGGTFYLRSEEEMRALMPELPEACDATARIAEQVDIRLDFGRTLLPDPGIPAGMTADDYLRRLCEEGLERRYHDPGEAQRERLHYELKVIAETGFAEYILIVRDIARFAHEQRIPMGVRGSAAASIVLYCLDVTDIEPTQYRLVFERFLNPERREMPDVDFDFADDRREEVIRYAAERYGRDRVAQIVTFGTLGAKAAIRDSGRALGMSYGEVDRVARLVPNSLGITLKRALDEVEDLRRAAEEDESVSELLDTARSLEGVARHASTHAAGIVISREPLVDVVPLQRATSSRDEDEQTLPTTQYDMNDVAKIGLLKLDFLGLANLTILGRAADLIGEHLGEPLDLETIPDGDEATADLLREGRTFGVFQLEGSGMRRWVTELQPRDIRELAAMIALYRPGPMEHIPRYIEVKHGRAAPHYPHEDLAGVLDETYGVITYQDQVLEIARTFAGYSLGHADVMRKAMGKKIPEVMLAERDRFIEGAVANGYDQLLAEQLFDMIEPFAGYAFNKAHALLLRRHRLPHRLAEGALPGPVHDRRADGRGRTPHRVAGTHRRGDRGVPPPRHLGAAPERQPLRRQLRNRARGQPRSRRGAGDPLRHGADQERRHGRRRGTGRRARQGRPVRLRRGLRAAHQRARLQPPRARIARQGGRGSTASAATAWTAPRSSSASTASSPSRRRRSVSATPARPRCSTCSATRWTRRCPRWSSRPSRRRSASCWAGARAARRLRLGTPVSGGGAAPRGVHHAPDAGADGGPRRPRSDCRRDGHGSAATDDAAGQGLRRRHRRGPRRQRRADGLARLLRGASEATDARQRPAREGRGARAQRSPHARRRRPRRLRPGRG